MQTNALIAEYSEKDTHLSPASAWTELPFKMSLPERLCLGIYTSGFVENLFSDITVKAMGMEFKLHKIILVQNSYFKGMLTGNWSESLNNTVNVHFDDPNITASSVEYIFARMYGHTNEIDTANPSQLTSILAASCFFDIEDLANVICEAIRANIDSKSVSVYLAFLNQSFYGTHSDSITDAIFTYLCRDATSDVQLLPVLEIMDCEFLMLVLGSDCFFVRDEMQRYLFFRDIILRRQHSNTTTINIPDSDCKSNSLDDDDTLVDVQVVPLFEKIPLPAIGASSTTFKDSKNVKDSKNDQSNDYLINALSQCVVYAQMSFQQLRKVRSDMLIDQTTIESSLWRHQEMSHLLQSLDSPSATPRMSLEDRENSVIGIAVPKDDTAKIDNSPQLSSMMVPCIYNTLASPPFRFGVEFRNLEALHSGIRVYSTEFYNLGSMWVVYLQKLMIDGTAKLGVYLQRNGTENIMLQNGEESRYVDQRVEVCAWFKIFCFVVRNANAVKNDRDRMDASNDRCFILQSKPDVFNISQSWGWRSNKLYKETFTNDMAVAESLRCCIIMGQV